MKSIPVIKNGVITRSDAGLPENESKNIHPAVKAAMNRIPPGISHLHAIKRINNSTSTGILCSKNPRSFSPKGTSDSKTSKENVSINRIAKMVKILGVQ